jgi:replicative DNA helicase
MLTPQKLLIALVDLNDPKLFLETQLREEFFKDPETKLLYSFINSHVKIHGTIPTKETITDNLSIELVEASEPYTYYLSRAESKYQYNLLNLMLKSSSDLLHNKELPDLVSLLSQTLDQIKGVTSNVTYLDVIENGPVITKINMDKNFHEATVLKTGWDYIDGMGGGVRQGDIISIVGRPSSGKTMLTLYMANDIVFTQNKRLLYYSTEMSSDQLMERIAAIYTGSAMTAVQTGEMSNWYKAQFFEKLKAFKTQQGMYHIIDGSQGALTVDDIALNVKAQKPDAVIIDGAYLLAHKDPKMDRYRKVADNVETLKRVASANKIPIICSFQFSREASKKKIGEKVGLSDIAYSDAIGQISTIVMGLFQSDDTDSAANNAPTRKIEILKGRNGESGSFEIQWDFETSNFSEFIMQEEMVY